MKRIKIEGLWLLHLCTKFHIHIWSCLWVIGLWNVENQIHTHTHTYIRVPAKNHISRRLKLFWVLGHEWPEEKKNSRKHSFLSEEAKTWKNCIYWYSSMTVRWLEIYWICDTSCDHLLHVRQNRLHFAIDVHCT